MCSVDSSSSQTHSRSLFLFLIFMKNKFVSMSGENFLGHSAGCPNKLFEVIQSSFIQKYIADFLKVTTICFCILFFLQYFTTFCLLEYAILREVTHIEDYNFNF